MSEDLKSRFLDGEVLLLDKPLRWTSFDVVNKVRYALKHKLKVKKLKVGHAGTLDPLASGLLILCTGRATKKINTFMADEKEYTGEFFIGATTPTYDLESEVDQTFPTTHIDESLIENSRQKFLGIIQQIPPVFSAIRKDGEKAYELARRGEKVELKAREIEIKIFETGIFKDSKIPFRIVCSKGTYIRSIAHDFGLALGSGAYLASLRRTRIGAYQVENAISPEDFVAELEKAD